MAATTLRDLPASRAWRMANAMWRQGSRSLVCPATPRLDGARAVVTGGNAGIGLAICRGLLRRGAEVVMASRNESKAMEARARLDEEVGLGAAVASVPLDLSDLGSVRESARALAERIPRDGLDLFVCNAGIWPQRYERSAQGHELAFATNVLGHFALIRHALDGLLAADGRIVILTGDIYVLARDCTPDYRFRTPFGGMLAYCRSKLGNHWLASELQRRHPGLRVSVAHPGVVATHLGGHAGGGEALRRRLLLDPDRGAQAPLYCATQPDLPPGVYVHNTLGPVRLPEADPARNPARAAGLWDACEALAAPFVPS